jgi:hypothetical protein
LIASLGGRLRFTARRHPARRPEAYARAMWTQCHSTRAVLVLVFFAGCASSSTKAATLADYAAGRWTCKLAASGASGGALQPTDLKASAVVTATSATNGRVAITISGLPGIAPGAPAPTKFGGQWALRSKQLAVTWDDKTQGTMQAEPIALNTTHFKTKSGAPESHPKWSQVTVHRQSRSVSFDFNMVPGVASPAQLTCSKG